MKRAILFAGLLCFMVSVCNSSSAPAKEARGKSTKEIHRLQEQCGKSSAEFFSRRPGIIGFSNPFYKNHYNRKLNKCFIQIWYPADGHGSDVLVGIIGLWDVKENMPYGSFHKPVGGNVEDCWVGNTKCGTVDDFKKLIRPYMEE